MTPSVNHVVNIDTLKRRVAVLVLGRKAIIDRSRSVGATEIVANGPVCQEMRDRGQTSAPTSTASVTDGAIGVAVCTEEWYWCTAWVAS